MYPNKKKPWWMHDAKMMLRGFSSFFILYLFSWTQSVFKWFDSSSWKSSPIYKCKKETTTAPQPDRKHITKKKVKPDFLNDKNPTWLQHPPLSNNHTLKNEPSKGRHNCAKEDIIEIFNNKISM